MLNGPKSEAFAKLLHARTQKLMGGAAAVLYGGAQPTEFAGGWWTALEARVSGRVLALLPQARHAHRTPRIFPLALHKALHRAAPHARRACTCRHASPQELPRLHGYVDETLALKPTLKDNLRKLTPAEFERVLHPVFEEDELTLVIVGAVLGGAVGWAQAWWDARSKRLDAESRGTPPPGLAP